MNTRHKWAGVAIAFAEGKKIQLKDYETGEWRDWPHQHFPRFDEAATHWQVKPAAPVVRWQWVYQELNGKAWLKSALLLTDVEADNHFSHRVKRFKDEASRVEFPAEGV